MIRVLHVYSGNLYGGVESMLAILARRRSLCPDMQPHFALSFEGRLSAELRRTGAPLHMLGEARVSRPWTVWRARRELAQVLGRERFQAIVCHSAWPQAIFGPVARAAGMPLVFWLHDAITGRHWLERWARLTPPDLAICNSQYTGRTLPCLYPGTHFEILYLPVEASTSSHSQSDLLAIRNQLHTRPDDVVIIQVSRLERWKGHSLHLEALGLLREVPGWICWLAGAPQRPPEARYFEELKEKAARLGIAERVRFLGWRSDIPLLLGAADIFCQPNTSPEPFGLVFIEALQHRLPVVTVAGGGVSEIVDSSCGILIARPDAAALADALRKLIKDSALRRSLGEAGPKRAQASCGVAAQLGKLHQILKGLAPTKAGV